MKKNTLLKIFAGTIFCFFISYACAQKSHQNSDSTLLKEKLFTTFLDTFGKHWSENSLEKEYTTNEGKNWNEDDQKHTFSADYIKGIKKISVNTMAMNIIFHASDTDSIEVVAHTLTDFKNDEDLMKISAEQGELKIVTNKNTEKEIFSRTNNDSKNVITITMPKTISELEMKTISGDISLPKSSFEKISIETVSGDIISAPMLTSTINLKTTSGDIHLAGDIQQVTGKTTSGDFTFEEINSSPQIDMETVSGDFVFRFKQIPDLNVEFSSVSGDIEIDQGNGEPISAGKKLKTTLGKGKGFLHIKTISGDVRVERSNSTI